jgi:hypothetical protein
MVAYVDEPNLANSKPNKQWSEIMKKPRIRKGELFRKIFAKKTAWRLTALDDARAGLLFLALFRGDQPGLSSGIVRDLNQAAPVAINLGNGWIECNGFGLVHPKLNMLSYRPRNHRSDCTALRGGIKLTEVKSIKLI